MANFDAAHHKLLLYEGSYSFDENDIGGETYCGIARKYHPNWEGWVLIDEAKQNSVFPHNLKSLANLDAMVMHLYKEQYWDKFCGDVISSQRMAEELYDISVNIGLTEAIRYLQIGLNILNRNGSMYADIKEDGVFGSVTLGTLAIYVTLDEEKYLLKLLNIQQGCKYIKSAHERSVSEGFLRGWLSRVCI